MQCMSANGHNQHFTSLTFEDNIFNGRVFKISREDVYMHVDERAGKMHMCPVAKLSDKNSQVVCRHFQRCISPALVIFYAHEKSSKHRSYKYSNSCIS